MSMSFRQKLYRGLQYIVHGTPIKKIQVNVSYLSPNQRLLGKRILVTGGGRGLGFSMAKKFISEGAIVLITGRNEEILRKSASEIGCKYLKFDIQNIKDIDDFFIKASEILGYIDCLVNNAGISLHEGNIRNVTLEQFDRQIDTNLKGGYFLTQRFLKIFEEKNLSNGNILFVSSERGSYVDDLPYGLTKVAVNSLVQGLAKRVIDLNIRVNAIAPGVTASEMTGFKENGDLYCPYNITERAYLPDEVAEVACFLLSDASNCLSGQILVCNEGKSINSHWR